MGNIFSEAKESTHTEIIGTRQITFKKGDKIKLIQETVVFEWGSAKTQLTLPAEFVGTLGSYYPERDAWKLKLVCENGKTKERYQISHSKLPVTDQSSCMVQCEGISEAIQATKQLEAVKGRQATIRAGSPDKIEMHVEDTTQEFNGDKEANAEEPLARQSTERISEASPELPQTKPSAVRLSLSEGGRASRRVTSAPDDSEVGPIVAPEDASSAPESQEDSVTQIGQKAASRKVSRPQLRMSRHDTRMSGTDNEDTNHVESLTQVDNPLEAPVERKDRRLAEHGSIVPNVGIASGVAFLATFFAYKLYRRCRARKSEDSRDSFDIEAEKPSL